MCDGLSGKFGRQFSVELRRESVCGPRPRLVGVDVPDDRAEHGEGGVVDLDRVLVARAQSDKI